MHPPRHFFSIGGNYGAKTNLKSPLAVILQKVDKESFLDRR